MFAQQNTDECKTDTEDKNGESDACLESPNTNKEETPLEHQVCNWLLATYRKIPKKKKPRGVYFSKDFYQLIMKISEIKLRRFEAILTQLSSKITVVVFEFKYKVTENSDVYISVRNVVVLFR